MSLSGALNNALGGLSVSGRSAALVSSNISNALTEGYGRRELAVSAATIGSHGGVRVDGVVRHSDPTLIADRRRADGELGAANILADAAKRLDDLMGGVLDEDSLNGRLQGFESALILASADPSSDQRLANVAQSADHLAKGFNAVSDGIQDLRLRMDVAIGEEIQRLNEALERVADINQRISTVTHVGRDISALLDQRQREIDAVAEIVPVRIIPRGRDTVALYTPGGQALLDGEAKVFDFRRSNEIAPHMTFESGLLSGIVTGDRELDGAANGPMSGGTLSALFEVRDRQTVDMQARLDGVARDLIDRFGPGGPDATIGAGQPGLFTDAGQAFVPASEAGIAQRLSLNPQLSPSGSELWRLRDGLGAATPGEVGDATLINALRDSMTSRSPAASAALRGEPVALTTHLSELATHTSDARLDQARAQTYAAGRQTALREQELAAGVDTDFELQKLMQVEQHYAANAQVIRVIDDLMQLLLR